MPAAATKAKLLFLMRISSSLSVGSHGVAAPAGLPHQNQMTTRPPW
jgi:hypothetical protein